MARGPAWSWSFPLGGLTYRFWTCLANLHNCISQFLRINLYPRFSAQLIHRFLETRKLESDRKQWLTTLSEKTRFESGSDDVTTAHSAAGCGSRCQAPGRSGLSLSGKVSMDSHTLGLPNVTVGQLLFHILSGSCPLHQLPALCPRTWMLSLIPS